jgi:hypothetical protein
LQAFLPFIPKTRLPVAAEWEEIRSRASVDGLPGGIAPLQAPGPLVAPILKAGEPFDEPIILEEDAAREYPSSAAGWKGVGWIKGSHDMIAWDSEHLFRVDSRSAGRPEILEPNKDGGIPAFSWSGEYVAHVARDEGSELDVLRLGRLGPKISWSSIDSASKILELAFSPRSLQLAYMANRDVRTYRLDGKSTTLLAGLSGRSARLAWSPNGRLLLVQEHLPGESRVRVYDPSTSTLLLERESGETSVVWASDSQGLVSLVQTGSSLLLRKTKLPTPGEPQQDRPTEGGSLPPDLLARERAFSRPTAGIAEHISWSPDGQRVLLRVRHVPEMTQDEGISRAPDGLDPTAAVEWISWIQVERAGGLLADRADPVTESDRTMAWHPSGGWYAAVQEGGPGFGALWLHDVGRKDAFPLGSSSAFCPRFSDDGRRLAFIDGVPGQERLVVVDLNPVAENVPLGRKEASKAAEALQGGAVEESIRRYRNAVRLAPQLPEGFHGLGRAYMAMAARNRNPLAAAYYLEGASRALASAYELAGLDPHVRVDFLDAMARRALVTGQLKGKRLSAEAKAAIQKARRGSKFDTTIRTARAAVIECVLWDPWNEYYRVLLAGLAARYPEEGP